VGSNRKTPEREKAKHSHIRRRGDEEAGDGYGGI